MKAIIDDLIYDSDTALYVSSDYNNCYVTDIYFKRETLYRTASGRWFLHGEGGAYSVYAQRHGDGTGWGEHIIPLSPPAARAWLNSHDPDAAAQWFAADLQEA